MLVLGVPCSVHDLCKHCNRVESHKSAQVQEHNEGSSTGATMALGTGSGEVVEACDSKGLKEAQEGDHTSLAVVRGKWQPP